MAAPIQQQAPDIRAERGALLDLCRAIVLNESLPARKACEADMHALALLKLGGKGGRFAVTAGPLSISVGTAAEAEKLLTAMLARDRKMYEAARTKLKHHEEKIRELENMANAQRVIPYGDAPQG